MGLWMAVVIVGILQLTLCEPREGGRQEPVQRKKPAH